MHACALKSCDLAKKAFINHLFRPQAILSVALSLLLNSKETQTTFSKKWFRDHEKLVPDQIF